MQGSGIGPSIGDADLDQKIVRGGLRIFDEDIEIAVLIEDSRIEQLVFEILAGPLPVYFEQFA